MAFDKDCPCTPECKKRPNCKGCVEGNAWRKKKHEEAEQRYRENTFHRYEMDKFNENAQKHMENNKKPKKKRNIRKLETAVGYIRFYSSRV